MKNTAFPNLLVLVALIAYHLLFWQEQMGLNTLLFAVLLLGFSIFLKIDEGFSKAATMSMVMTFLTAVFVVWHNSDLSKVVHLLSAVTTIGFIHRPDFEHTGYAFLSGLLGIFYTPVHLSKDISIEHAVAKIRPAWLYARFAFVPIFFLMVFYVLYAVANPKFAELSTNFVSFLGELLSSPFQHISWWWFGFIGLGLLVSGSVMWQPIQEWFKAEQASRHDILLRQRRSVEHHLSFGMLALKNEYRIGLMVICSLNALLFLVNMVDIRYLWLDFSEYTSAQFSQFIHESTYVLIASILLAMAIVGYFFRNNLNFYKKNTPLRVATYLWIIQNAALALSVGVRNFRYIDTYGLSYRRVGVMVFLLMTLFGLLTMYFKVRDIKSFYYLIKTNAWALYIIMTLTCFVNWDVLITRHNLTAEIKRIDYVFLLEKVSDKNLHVLYQHEDYIQEKFSTASTAISKKRAAFLQRQTQISWASWNYADYRNKRFLTGNNAKARGLD